MTSLINFFSSNAFFTTFIATFLTGENAIVPALIIANQGYSDLKIAIISTFLGSLSIDLFWYVLSKFFSNRLGFQKWFDEKNVSNQFLIQYFLYKKPIITFIFIKFLIGIRIILNVSFVVVKKMKFSTFLGLSLVSNVIFISILYVISYLISTGLGKFSTYKNISTIMVVIFITIVVANISQVYIRKYLERKNNLPK